MVEITQAGSLRFVSCANDRKPAFASEPQRIPSSTAIIARSAEPAVRPARASPMITETLPAERRLAANFPPKPFVTVRIDREQAKAIALRHGLTTRSLAIISRSVRQARGTLSVRTSGHVAASPEMVAKRGSGLSGSRQRFRSGRRVRSRVHES